MSKINFQKEAKKAFLIELEELLSFSKSKHFDVDKFCRIIFQCKGKVFLTGVGKSGHIASKISATLSSTGTPSFFIHPAEALHGDLGMLSKGDLIFALSKSGESKEICDLLPALKNSEIKIISITESETSTIALASNAHLTVRVNKEACPNDLAPTSSTTLMLALGDSIAVSLLKAKKFTSKDFAKTHPGGKLGRKLILKVKDIMVPIKKAPVVQKDDMVKRVMIEISKKKQGFALIEGEDKEIIGIFSDGDLRRSLQKKLDLETAKIDNFMTKNFKVISKDQLVVDAAKFMSKHKIYSLVVSDEGEISGFITMHEILEANVL